jgi:hypothetical protein
MLELSTRHIELPPLLVACEAHVLAKVFLMENFACASQKNGRAWEIFVVFVIRFLEIKFEHYPLLFLVFSLSQCFM